jgi:hypothetical protein
MCTSCSQIEAPNKKLAVMMSYRICGKSCTGVGIQQEVMVYDKNSWSKEVKQNKAKQRQPRP